jgi:hypothetical protein
VADELLHVCRKCERIGSEQEAWAHQAATGHATEALDAATSDAVRAERHEQRMNRLAGFMALARLHGAALTTTEEETD